MTGKPSLLAIFLIVPFLCVSGTCVFAEDARPLVLMIPGSVGEAETPSDADVVGAVKAFLMDSGRVEVITFHPEHPTIVRSVLEGKLKRDVIGRASEPQKAAEIARAVGAGYALIVRGSVVGNEVGVTLQLLSSRGAREWTAGSESRVAPGTGPTHQRNRENAISTAASAAVSQLGALAVGRFAPHVSDKPIGYSAPPLAPAETSPVRDLTAEYTGHMQKADIYSKRGDVPNLIYELRQAVNIEPQTVSVRIKLAEAYASLGMVEEAIDECRRALAFRPDNVSLHRSLADLYAANGALAAAAAQYEEVTRLDPDSVEGRINLGNVYWNQGKLDAAAAMFEEATKLDPENPVPHTRLYKLYCARQNHAAALKHLVLSKTTGDTSQNSSRRFDIITGIVRGEFDQIVGKLDTAQAGFVGGELTREEYYRECRDAGSRAEALAEFLSGQSIPEEYKASHAHGLLAVSMLSQSAGSLLSYLETDKSGYADQAELLRMEARSELNLLSAAGGE